MSEQNDSVATVHSIVSADYKLQTNRPSSSYCCRCTATLVREQQQFDTGGAGLWWLEIGGNMYVRVGLFRKGSVPCFSWGPRVSVTHVPAQKFGVSSMVTYLIPSPSEFALGLRPRR